MRLLTLALLLAGAGQLQAAEPARYGQPLVTAGDLFIHGFTALR